MWLPAINDQFEVCCIIIFRFLSDFPLVQHRLAQTLTCVRDVRADVRSERLVHSRASRWTCHAHSFLPYAQLLKEAQYLSKSCVSLRCVILLRLTSILIYNDQNSLRVTQILSPLRLCPCRTPGQGCRHCTCCPRQSRERGRPPRFQRQTGSSGPPDRKTVRRWGEARPTLCSPSDSSGPGRQKKLCKRRQAPEIERYKLIAFWVFCLWAVFCILKLAIPLPKRAQSRPQCWWQSHARHFPPEWGRRHEQMCRNWCCWWLWQCKHSEIIRIGHSYSKHMESWLHEESQSPDSHLLDLSS